MKSSDIQLHAIRGTHGIGALIVFMLTVMNSEFMPLLTSKISKSIANGLRTPPDRLPLSKPATRLVVARRSTSFRSCI